MKKSILLEARLVNEKHTDKYIQLGLNIAYYRKLRGLTQMQMAEKVSLSRTYISNIEAPNTRCSLSLEKLFDIADVLHVEVDKLLRFRE